MKQKNAAASRPFLAGLLVLTGLTLSPAALAEKFAIVILPDTQFYPETNPNIFYAQTEWIKNNRQEDKENIIYVAHLGDIINGDCASSIAEWTVADRAMETLEEVGVRVPYGILPGNHDWDPAPSPSTVICPVTARNRYNGVESGYENLGFGPDRFDPLGSNYGNQDGVTNDNNFVLFESGGVKFIALNFAYVIGGPSETIIEWAWDMLDQNRDRKAIVTSHFVLEENTADSRREDGQTAFGPLGQAVYDKLDEFPNFFLMLGAHRRGEAWRIEQRDGMDDVHILLSNYQDYAASATPNWSNVAQNTCPPPIGGPGCGDLGLMRIMRFDTDLKQVTITTFAPNVNDPTGPILESGKTVTRADRGITEMNSSTASNLSFEFNPPPVTPLPPTNLTVE